MNEIAAAQCEGFGVSGDVSASALSLACAVHCACTPLLVTAAPWLTTPAFEAATTLALLTFSVGVILRGAWVHGSYASLPWAVVGGCALGVNTFGDVCCRSPMESQALLVVSTVALLTAHGLNARGLVRCRRCAAS